VIVTGGCAEATVAAAAGAAASVVGGRLVRGDSAARGVVTADAPGTGALFAAACPAAAAVWSARRGLELDRLGGCTSGASAVASKTGASVAGCALTSVEGRRDGSLAITSTTTMPAATATIAMIFRRLERGAVAGAAPDVAAVVWLGVFFVDM